MQYSKIYNFHMRRPETKGEDWLRIKLYVIEEEGIIFYTDMNF